MSLKSYCEENNKINILQGAFHVYCCKDCGFLFRRVGEVQTCPFCEGKLLRPATAEEAKHLQILLNNQDGNG